jgi:hypothetical protein
MATENAFFDGGSSPPASPGIGMTPHDNSARTTTTPARTAPCHCGSGRKYKHCHQRHDKEQERLINLQPFMRVVAMHEAGHVLADFLYNIPIGDEGVWICEDGGFTDSRPTQRYKTRSMFDASREDRQEYFVGSFIGPVVEFRHRGLTLEQLSDKDVRCWMSDFAAALCIRGERISTCVTYSHEQFHFVEQLTVACFFMLAYPEKTVPPLEYGGLGDIVPELKEAMVTADKLATQYADDINQFADLLLAKGKVSKEECAELAQKFQKAQAATA